MLKVETPQIERFDAIDFRLEQKLWSFEIECAAEIDRHWAKLIGVNPLYFNGRVLLMPRVDIAATAQGRCLEGTCFATDYKAFQAWRDFGCPETGIKNVFAMAALRSADGAFLLGEMGASTASAGKIYFPAGTPDPSDLSGDKIDFDANVLRELAEETGIPADEITVEPGWHVVFHGPRIACMKIIRSPLSAAELVTQVAAFIAAEEQPELARLYPVHDLEDLDRKHMPDFTLTYLTAALTTSA